MNTSRDIKKYNTLSATIFNHYFQKIPPNKSEYEELLRKLMNMNIFLIDISDVPLKIRDKSSPNQINKENYKILLSEIPKLREKIKSREIEVKDENITFLLPRNGYKTILKKSFLVQSLVAG